MSELTEKYSVEKIAKILADKIGHGMTEKCIKHAEILFDVISVVEKQTAEKCAQIALDLNDDGKWNGYHISRKIQEDYGVDV